MKSKIILVIVALLLSRFQANANVISVNDAQTVSLNFYKINANYSDQHIPLTATLNFAAGETDGTIDFYVFDINPGHGFVIVSATDNVTPVLAYSTETNFNSNFPEIGLKGWMHNVSGRIHTAILENMPAGARITDLWAAYRQGERPGGLKSNVVSPMLSTQWNQYPYYNLFCPYDSVSQARCVTGCLATAMAQIMKYWAYPDHGTGYVSYADSVIDGFQYNIGTVSADLAATTYQWSQMPAQVTGDADDTAVALLMYQCGVAAGMDYGVNGSLAYISYTGHHNVYSAFVTNFGYDADSIQYQQTMYNDSAKWMPMILKELNAGRPVLYTGQDTANHGGHGWVCDGYDVNEMLHMNWGWGGMDNGYFLTSNLNASPYNFTWFQSAIIGIQPPPATATALNDVTANTGFKLFPNPASNYLTIEANAGYAQARYAIYDIFGNRISVGTFAGYSNKIEVSNWAAGVYFIRLPNPQQETTVRFIVNK